MQHRNVRGKIRYTSAKAGREGVERGREWFNFTHHADGSVIMTAQCEIEDPDPRHWRSEIKPERRNHQALALAATVREE